VYELVVKGAFSAAHALRNYHGKCEALHGHNFKVEVYVRSEGLGPGGMALDFAVIKRELRAALEGVDHRYLNDLPYFQDKEPSSENLARMIFEEMQRRLEGKGVEVYKVTVWESEGAGASYLREP